MKMIEEEFQTANVGGLHTACLTRKQLVNHIINKVRMFRTGPANRAFVISSSNGHSVSLYNSDSHTKELMDNADLLHADGQSIVSLSKRFSENTIPERSATTDMFTDIPEYCSDTVNHYLFGGKSEIVAKCADIMPARFSNFKLSGYQDGYFEEKEIDNIISAINSAAPDILWIGLGKPREQEFVYQYRERLKVPVIITCGGCFNYVTGDYKRAPMFMQKLGLEWLHRALTEPRKLLWRYFTTNPHAVYCAFKHRDRSHK